jgi:toxin ParE1/3/4
LKAFLSLAEIVPEFDNKNIREVFAYSYRIVYRVDDEAVTIAAVIHGKRAFVSSPLGERIDQ